jgi:hypothetical protein
MNHGITRLKIDVIINHNTTNNAHPNVHIMENITNKTMGVPSTVKLLMVSLPYRC